VVEIPYLSQVLISNLGDSLRQWLESGVGSVLGMPFA